LINTFLNKIRQKYRTLTADSGARKKTLHQILKVTLWAVVGIVILNLLLFIAVWSGIFGKLPSGRELSAIENQLSSEIYAENGELLGKYFIYDRSHANLNQISENVINSLIATEDVRFYDHNGIDFKSLARVVFKTILLGDESSGGGSTITQQLAKNIFARKNQSAWYMPVNKLKEMIIARRLENVYSKNEILTLYLNTVPFGENVYGISAASLRYFNKNPLDLTIEEAAVLVGMLKATTYYNPRVQTERATTRRNVVIAQLRRYDYITQQAADSLFNLPIEINYNPMSHNQGPAPYFRETLRKQMVEILSEYNTKNQTDYNLFTDGLKIYTTINYDLQLMAEAAMKRQISRQQKILDNYYRNISRQSARPVLNTLMKSSDRYQSLVARSLTETEISENFNTPQFIDVYQWNESEPVEITPLDSIFMMQKLLHAGLLSLDPANGYVRAWVGGIDFRFFQYDHVLAQRQAGSTFKPFLYATALQMGVDPCEYVSNEQKFYEEYENWSPVNSNREYTGYYSMTGALANSVNTISAHYIDLTGVLPVIENAHKSGIKSYLPPVPSLALGAASVNLLELTAAYSTYLNNGTYIDPQWLLQIEDKNGKILYKGRPVKEQAGGFDAGVSMLTRKMMEAVVDSGTAGSLRHTYGLTGDLAGKTGTTQNNTDTWFIGFTPNLVTGVWTGLENPAFTQIFKSPVNSSNSAVPFWGEYHRRISGNPATRNYLQGSFLPLPDSLASKLDCSMYLDELPPENWWDVLFGTQKEKPKEKKPADENRRGSRLRKWLENLF